MRRLPSASYRYSVTLSPLPSPAGSVTLARCPSTSHVRVWVSARDGAGLGVPGRVVGEGVFGGVAGTRGGDRAQGVWLRAAWRRVGVGALGVAARRTGEVVLGIGEPVACDVVAVAVPVGRQTADGGGGGRRVTGGVGLGPGLGEAGQVVVGVALVVSAGARDVRRGVDVAGLVVGVRGGLVDAGDVQAVHADVGQTPGAPLVGVGDLGSRRVRVAQVVLLGRPDQVVGGCGGEAVTVHTLGPQRVVVVGEGVPACRAARPPRCS